MRHRLPIVVAGAVVALVLAQVLRASTNIFYADGLFHLHDAAELKAHGFSAARLFGWGVFDSRQILTTLLYWAAAYTRHPLLWLDGVLVLMLAAAGVALSFCVGTSPLRSDGAAVVALFSVGTMSLATWADFLGHAGLLLGGVLFWLGLARRRHALLGAGLALALLSHRSWVLLPALGAPVLWLERRRWHALALTAAGLLAAALYWSGPAPAAFSPSRLPWQNGNGLQLYLRFWLSYLGAGAHPLDAGLAPWLGALLLALTIARGLRRPRPPLALTLIVGWLFVTSIIFTITRGDHPPNAVHMHYRIYPALWWAAILGAWWSGWRAFALIPVAAALTLALAADGRGLLEGWQADRDYAWQCYHHFYGGGEGLYDPLGCTPKLALFYDGFMEELQRAQPLLDAEISLDDPRLGPMHPR